MKLFICFFAILFCFSALAQTGISTPINLQDTSRFTWKGKSKEGRRDGKWTATSQWNTTIKAQYENGMLNGPWTVESAKGKLLEEGTYVNGLRDGTWVTTNYNGDTTFCCNYKNGVLDGEYKTFEWQKRLTRHGFFVNGKKNGTWLEKVYTPNHLLLAKIVYNYKMDTLHGTVVEECYKYTKKTTYENGNVVKKDSVATFDDVYVDGEWPPNPDPVLAFAEEMPHFKGGEAAFQKYLQENMQYPKSARDNKLQGSTYIYFVVEKDGSISNVYCMKGVPDASELDLEAMRVIKTMPNWEPGKMNGKPVRVSMTVPIKFVLDK